MPKPLINDFVHENNMPVGAYGGSRASELVQPGDNELHQEHIEEADKAIDEGTKSSWNGWQKDGGGTFIDRKI